MKLYRNLVNAVAQTLQEIFRNNRYADKALEKTLKQNPQWGSRDRRFVAEGVYDCVRNYRLYSELAGSKENYWFIVSVWLVVRQTELPDWPEFRHVDPDGIQKHHERLKSAHPAIILSYPDWLWQAGEEELGATAWLKEATAMHQQAEVFIRANTLKTSASSLKARLQESGIETVEVPLVAGCLQLKKRENIFRNPLFKDGMFEVQDAGSQMIGEFVQAQPGHTVIDACAGAGGKSLHLSALMKNKGRILSMDVEGWKLDELKKRASRAGAYNIETRPIVGTETIASLQNKADRVLLDVPCSGLGVLKRNPDAKWKLSADVISRTKQLQSEILSSYSKMVAPAGQLIYSTCSVLPSENQQQVRRFIESDAGFRLAEEKTLLPSDGFDGFYMARLVRVNT